MYLFRFAKYRPHNPWVDAARDDLCKSLIDRKPLVTIFNFKYGQNDAKLEDAILEAVFNGSLFSKYLNLYIDLILAAKFSHESTEEHHSAAELRLALVNFLFKQIILK